MPNWIDWRVRKPRDSLVYCNKYNARRSWQIRGQPVDPSKTAHRHGIIIAEEDG